MQRRTRANYLETEVMTAPPERLQMLLIDAAIKNLQRGKLLWRGSQDDEACEALIRAQQIVAQILSGLNREADAELARKVAAIYLCVFRTIGEAQSARDDDKLDHCIRILDVERQTWRMLCEQLEKERAAASGAGDAFRPATNDPPISLFSGAAHPTKAVPPRGLSAGDAGGVGFSTGFSIEA